MADRYAGLHVVIWALIFGGLLIAGLGCSLVRMGHDWGRVVVGFGALDAAIGLVLIWVRSRLPDHPPGADGAAKDRP